MSISNQMTVPEAAGLKRSYEAKFAKLRKTSGLFEDLIPQLKAQHKFTHASLVEIMLLVDTAAYDISKRVIDLALEKDAAKNLDLAGEMATYVLESTQELQQKIGDPLEDVLKKLGIYARFQTEIQAMRAALASFISKQHNFLLNVKNNGASDADSDTCLSAGMEIGNIHNDMGSRFQKIFEVASKTNAPEYP